MIMFFNELLLHNNRLYFQWRNMSEKLDDISKRNAKYFFINSYSDTKKKKKTEYMYQFKGTGNKTFKNCHRTSKIIMIMMIVIC